jgi:hypothetical protein
MPDSLPTVEMLDAFVEKCMSYSVRPFPDRPEVRLKPLIFVTPSGMERVAIAVNIEGHSIKYLQLMDLASLKEEILVMADGLPTSVGKLETLRAQRGKQSTAETNQ